MIQVESVAMFAYACDPNRGSEPGNGWHWASSVANRGLRVELVTPAENRVVLDSHLPHDNLTVHYVDLPSTPGRGNGRIRMYQRYTEWLDAGVQRALELGLEKTCDVAHHTTWGGLYWGVGIHKLNMPTVAGPLGGGQTIPRCLRSSLAPSDRFQERMRADLYRRTLRVSGAQSSLGRVSVAVASSDSAKSLLGRIGQVDAVLELPDGLAEVRDAPRRFGARGPGEEFRVVWVGRPRPIKGLPIAIEAVIAVGRQCPDLVLTVIGDGPDVDAARLRVSESGMDGRVVFRGSVPHAEVREILGASDLLLFTSLRDTFGAQVLEAMGEALPVLALAHHGVGDHCPEDSVRQVLPVKSAQFTVKELAKQLVHLYSDPGSLTSLSAKGLAWARTQVWEEKAKRMEEIYGRAICK